MSLLRWLSLALVGLFTLLAAAPARAGDVFLYRHPSEVPASQISTLVTTLTTMGAVVDVTTSSTWPTSYSGYNLVIILGPSGSFSASQTSALDAFVNGGGRLVVSGDYEYSVLGSAAVNSNVDALMTGLGVGIQIDSALLDGFAVLLSGTCSNTSGLGTDALLSGVSNLWYIATNSLTLSGSATTLASVGASTVLAVDQTASASTARPPYDVIVSADYDILTDYCSGRVSGDNVTFWENLYAPYVGACVDSDGDGFDDAACGGDDCDDTSASVNPDADEVCNTLDDDCDSAVDEDAVDFVSFYDDGDSDGFGDPDDATDACAAPSGHVSDASDCDDTDGAVNPDADELCNDADDDCDSAIDEDATDLATFYADDDADGFGDAADAVDACDVPADHVTDASDCDDADGAINPDADEVCNEADDDCDSAIDEDATDWPLWYYDGDSDDYGDAATTDEACAQPAGYVDNNIDCDDDDGDVFPGADESCNDADDDCDAAIDEDAVDGATFYADDDGDGFGDPDVDQDACDTPSGHVSDASDCDDADGAVNPDADELCNDADDDCDSAVDEDATDEATWYHDADGDSYGDPTDPEEACDAPADHVADDQDCHDANRLIYPGAEETCNGFDDDCDSVTDEDATDTTVYYDDGDSDGFGDAADTASACETPSGYVDNPDDCDDTVDTINPDGVEVCNGLDDDCDVTVDEGATDPGVWYADGDSDDYGDTSSTLESCSQPDGYVANGADCDDADASVNPDGAEICNEVDDDCDSAIDEDASDLGTWYADDDADGYGDPDDAVDACDVPADHVTDASDCDDTDGAIFPGAEEVCNEADDDCDSTIDEDAADAGVYYSDADADGFGDPDEATETCVDPGDAAENGDDCDDDDAGVNPDADELCDEVDQDCDTLIDEDAVDAIAWYVDGDGDGFGDAADAVNACDAPEGYGGLGGDCDDSDADIFPGADETAYDGVDQDCDGVDLTDVDGDGYDAAVVGGGDCADLNAEINPGATEDADGIDEDCDATVDETTDWHDDDGDGYAESGGDCDDADDGVNPAVDPEECDEVDEDCDGEVDEGTACYDDDGDGFTEDEGDCNDADAAVTPGAGEIDDNGVDDDCDGVIDSGFNDQDGDGYAPVGGDCDDGDADTSPASEDVFDGVDNDCDGEVDEGTAFYDDDGDGFTEDEGDCDDSESTVGPGAGESPDGVDEDCDGVVDEGTELADDDGDGFSEFGGDCDDENPEVFPGADEVANGADDDCDGVDDEGIGDVDQDGWTVGDGDCDDGEGWVNPGAPEMCDGLDNDCDLDVDEDCEDDMLDGGEKECGCGATGTGGAGGALLWMLPLVAAVWRRRAAAPMAAAALAVTLGAGCSQDFKVNQLPTELEISPDLSDLGTVAAGVPITIPVELTARSGAVVLEEVVITHTLSTGPDGEAEEGEWFSFSGELVTLSADESVTLELDYFGDAPGYHHAVIEVVSDAQTAAPPIEVRAHAEFGDAALSPTSLEFGPVSPGDDATMEVLLSNVGPVEWTLAAAAVEPPFYLDEALPQTLSAGSDLSLEVRYSPEDADAASGSMSLDLGGVAVVPSVALRGNDCEGGLPEAYDRDADGWTTCAGDCDDSDPMVNSASPELADGVDQDCDGIIDEGTTAYDDDSDGFSEDGGDCNDADAAVSPGAKELPDNGIDDDCDGEADDGTDDLDGDGYTPSGGDCDDEDAGALPGAAEIADGVDQDCDGIIDEGTTAYDDDGDGFSESAGDCDDSDAEVNPNAVELADWIDNDCDGDLDENTVNADDDGDGFTEVGGDCDDADDEVNPAAWEIQGDGVDNDCDGVTD